MDWRGDDIDIMIGYIEEERIIEERREYSRNVIKTREKRRMDVKEKRLRENNKK